MYFLEDRIKRIIVDLGKLIYTERMEVNNLQIRYGEIPKPVQIEALTDGWQDYIPGTPWCSSSEDVYALFRTDITIPQELEGKKVVLSVKTNHNGWNALNPQMLLYIDGEEYQGLDTNHTEVWMDDCTVKGKTYNIMVYAFSGLTMNSHTAELREESQVCFILELRAAQPLIEELYYNLIIPHQLLAQLPEGSADRVNLTSILNDTINKLDLRIAYSKEFYDSVEEANEYIKEQLNDKTFGQDATVSCVGHTHIDVAWLWRYCHTREKAVRSFTTVLRMMEQYPEYTFMSSQPQLYEYIKEDHPEVFERIKMRVKEGRWEPEGGMWVEPDINVPSGESLVRQFLYGKRFFEKEFGVDNKVLWLPDVFGYSGNLPQIMKKSGVDYFMTAKLAYNEINKFPYQTFLWKGIDGSEVLSHLINNQERCYNAPADAQDIVQGWNNYAHKDINNDILMPFGFGDGGGGPTKDMLESIRRYNKGLPGSPKTKITGVRTFFEKLDKKVRNSKRLPKWVGELYFEWHRGTYTTMARNKKYNRKAEFLYASAEWISSFNNLLSGTRYPYEELKDGWKGILLNQFHDVLPGSSIKEVYEDTDKIYKKVFETGNRVLDEGLGRIAASVKTDGPVVVVFNPLSWRRDGLIEFSYPSDQGLICLEGEDGETFECQRTDAIADTYISYVKGVMPKGYTSYKIIEITDSTSVSEDGIQISESLLENRFFKISLDQTGSLTSIYDKRANREVLKAGERGNVLQAFEDKPMKDPFWGSDADNWNLDMFYSEKMWEVDEMVGTEVIEKGPIQGILRVRRKFLNSYLTQDIVLYRDIPRIDFKTVIDWKEKDIVLKAAFPVDINSDRATYEIQFGHIERDTHWNTSWDMARFEVCGHKWADLSEGGYGVSLLNDCKYGHDIKDGVMRLTLLRSCTTPNPDADREVHEFAYSLYPHAGDWKEAGTLQEAYDFNCPLLGIVTENEEGNLPAGMSMISTNKENVIVEAVKMAEDSDEIIIRVYEAYNMRSDVEVKLFQNIGMIKECNLMEKELDQEINNVRHEGNMFSFTIKPFEIKTFKVSFG